MKFFAKEDRFGWARSERGLSIFFTKQGIYEKALAGRGPDWADEAALWMQRLLECGDADSSSSHEGIWIASDDAVRLDEVTRDRFELPPIWPGSLRLDSRSVPNLRDFDAALFVIDERDRSVPRWRLEGPILVVGEDEFYLPSPEHYACLRAFQQWRAQESRTESDHLRLLLSLGEAAKSGTRIDLSRAPDVDVVDGGEIIISMTEHSDGSVELTPMFANLLRGASPESWESLRRKVTERLHHLEGDEVEGIVRVGNKIVLLDPEQTTTARAVARRQRVPASEKSQFLREPEAWMADHVFIHGEVEFLPRVVGIGEWKGGYLGGGGELGEAVDWFDKKPDALGSDEDEGETCEDEEAVGGESGSASTEGLDGLDEDGNIPEDEEDHDTSGVRDDAESTGADAPDSPIGPLVPMIETNDEELRWGVPYGEFNPSEDCGLELDFDGFPRKPYPHQIGAIRWLANHTVRAGEPRRWNTGDTAWGAGALLADDMGLGKTLSTLLFIGLWYERWRLASGKEPSACLVVAPLSLVENWKEETLKSFPEDRLPFSRMICAIPAADLGRYYATQNGRDRVAADGSRVEEYGLKFGDGTEASLDCPGSLVITTYQTLREFRFSFAGCDWGATIFDEAHNIKNPNALQTIAAKSLKAFFRVALTGTPVENHLGDLWSLMDAVEPGALGSFAEFREKWIRRLRIDPTQMNEVGQQLRDYLSNLILRRTKEEELKGLPRKTLRPVKIPMTPSQLERYDEILRLAKSTSPDDAEKKRTNHHLACMWELRRITLHPDLVGGGLACAPSSERASRTYLAESGKLRWLLEKLDEIQSRGEKALIFSIQKSLQDMLVTHLRQIYKIPVPLINGDTKATSQTRPNDTRLGLIRQFCDRPGFGICVLSPIAAGAGLNIVAANHVIHLERHWNPAKEDQATDRAYRIGQEKEVEVHIPLLVHPNRPQLTTFDLGLDKLIGNKRSLAGSLGLIPVAPVSADELFSEVFGDGAPEGAPTKATRISIDEALKLSWELFEALIAEIYGREANSVILTPKGRDGGADVIVREFGPESKNILVQCKMTGRSILDSDHAVREVIGAKPGHARSLNLPYLDGAVHTTAKTFSKRTKRAANPEGIELHGSRWLKDALARHEVTLTQILRRNRTRKRVV
ncbi:MAG: restriction endonuclease [Verrucomicrobiales bacterium]|jgi:superfamily II DNA or RNA helicase|nr:restriction endonuclease [Verrucomicrobiales bacterium]MBP9222500.1 restriction endonuclease [Verrucomicrobiales bacterium]